MRIKLFFVLIILLAFVIRVYKLGDIPGSLNPDEAALGYTSYSLLKAGVDEHGVVLPIALRSFGDGKLPVYSYLSIPFIALFGLSEFSTRLLSALAGVVGVFFIYRLVLRLFANPSISLVAALLYAISSWNIYFSHAAYEVNVATTLFLGAVVFYLEYKASRKDWYIIGSSLLFGLNLFTYHAYILFTPLFLLGLVVLEKKIFQKNNGVIVAGIVLSLSFIVVYFTVLSGSVAKGSSVGIFNNENVIYNRVEKLRGDTAPKNEILERALYTKYFGVSYQIIQNYLASFSPAFLFDKGGQKLVHNMEFFGNLYVFDALFLSIGFAILFYQRNRALPFLLLWLLLGPIPSAITEDAPNSARLFILMPLFIVISSVGVHYVFVTLFHSKFFRPVGYIVAGLMVLNVLYFLNIYFVHFNYHRVRYWSYGKKQSVDLAQKYPTYSVVMRGPENFNYIYFLFYTRYDPKKFISEVKYEMPTKEGFIFVKGFGRYQFPHEINYQTLQPRTIYVDDTRLDDKNHSIFLPSGEPVLGFMINN